MKDSTKKILLIGGSILVLGGVGFWFYRYSKKKKEEKLLAEQAAAAAAAAAAASTTPMGSGSTAPSGGGSTAPSGGGSITPGGVSPSVSNPFKTKEELIAFQQWVINTKNDKTILGKGGSTGYGDDGVWGTKGANAWAKYGTEYLNAQKASGTPETPKFGSLQEMYNTLSPEVRANIDTVSKMYSGIPGNGFNPFGTRSLWENLVRNSYYSGNKSMSLITPDKQLAIIGDNSAGDSYNSWVAAWAKRIRERNAAPFLDKDRYTWFLKDQLVYDIFTGSPWISYSNYAKTENTMTQPTVALALKNAKLRGYPRWNTSTSNVGEGKNLGPIKDYRFVVIDNAVVPFAYVPDNKYDLTRKWIYLRSTQPNR